MELIRQHTNSFLFQNIENSYFNEIFQLIGNNTKGKFELILRYIDNLLSLTLESDDSQITALHINFSTNLTKQERDLIAEYLLLKFHILNVKFKSEDIEGLENEIQILTNKINNFCYPARRNREYPNGVSTIEYNELVSTYKKNKALLKFYKSFNKKLRFRLFFNSTTKQIQSIKNHFEYFPVAIELNDATYCSNLLNSNKTLNDIDGINSEIINELESVVLFDCERKSIMTNFSFEEINKWNTEYGANFRKYLIITFGKELPSINSIRNITDTIRERFKIPANTSYTVLSSELDFLLDEKEKSSTLIEFIGVESSNFWDIFLLETSIRELYELRSIKLMNIYSLCLTDEIKNYILSELFSKNETSELITSGTKMQIHELREEDIEVMKKALSNTLDLIINSEIKTRIIKKLNNSQLIVLDEAIIRNSKLISKFINALGITRLLKLKPWSELKNDGSTSFLILSYRDQGKFPNYYYPNLFEFEYNDGTFGKAILHNFLFGNLCKWSRYTILKEYYKYLSHPIRSAHFEWDKLKKLIQAQKPEAKFIIDWNLENEYSSPENKETYKIKLLNQRAKTFQSSDLLIYTERNSEKPRIGRVKWFFENIYLDETKYEIQKLDELLDEFNPAERLIDTTQQEKELEFIRKQLGLENESAGRIWKILLNKKSALVGVESLYEELKLLFTNNNIPLVKQSYLINYWLNTESDTLMPRGNKVVKILFDYLNISNNYKLILYRLKNASFSGKIEATKKYSSLLKDLFEDGCFDGSVSLNSIIQSKIQQYKKNHLLEELGIDNEDPLKDLTTLVGLIQPEINLLELETIEKNDP